LHWEKKEHSLLRWDFEVAARYVLAGETFGVSKTMILVW
jgi:hypothetical protein